MHPNDFKQSLKYLTATFMFYKSSLTMFAIHSTHRELWTSATSVSWTWTVKTEQWNQMIARTLFYNWNFHSSSIFSLRLCSFFATKRNYLMKYGSRYFSTVSYQGSIYQYGPDGTVLSAPHDPATLCCGVRGPAQILGFFHEPKHDFPADERESLCYTMLHADRSIGNVFTLDPFQQN